MSTTSEDFNEEEQPVFPQKTIYPGVEIQVVNEAHGAISRSLRDSLAEIHDIKEIVSQLKDLGDHKLFIQDFPQWNEAGYKKPVSVSPRQPIPGLTIKIVRPQLGAVSTLLNASLKAWRDEKNNIDMSAVQIEAALRWENDESTNPDISLPSIENGHQIRLVGGEKDEVGSFIAEQKGEAYTVTFRYRGKEIKAENKDCFSAFCLIRNYLAEEGLIPFCYGASLNVYLTEEMRKLGHGLLVVKLYPNKPTSIEHFSRIFEAGPDVVPASVQDQEIYWNEWRETLSV